MSDISLPPETPKTPEHKNRALRAFVMFIALVSPVPLLICASDLWLTLTAEGQDIQQSPFALIRQMLTGAGDPPLWLLPLSILPSFLVLMILGRTAAARAAAILMLFFFVMGEIMLVGHIGESFIR